MSLPFYENQDSDFWIQCTSMSDFPAHIHQHLEIIFVESGAVFVSIDGSEHILETGDCAVVFPQAVHSYSQKAEENSVLLSLCSVELAGEFRNTLLTKFPQNPIVPKSQLHKDAHYALRSLSTESVNGSVKIKRALLQLFLARTLSCFQLVSLENAAYHTLIQEVVCYIMGEYYNPITLQSVAKAIGISQYQLSRLFTNKLHISFTCYLQQLRIEKAKELLLSTNLSITEIGSLSGFETPRNFNRVFLSSTGFSPRGYRSSNEQ